MRVKQKPATRPGSLSRSRMLKWNVLNDWNDWSFRLSANGLNVWNYLNAKRLPSPEILENTQPVKEMRKTV